MSPLPLTRLQTCPSLRPLVCLLSHTLFSLSHPLAVPLILPLHLNSPSLPFRIKTVYIYLQVVESSIKPSLLRTHPSSFYFNVGRVRQFEPPLCPANRCRVQSIVRAGAGYISALCFSMGDGRKDLRPSERVIFAQSKGGQDDGKRVRGGDK